MLLARPNRWLRRCRGPSWAGRRQVSEPVVIEQADDRLHGERKHDLPWRRRELRRNQSEKRLTSASAAAGSVSEFGRSLTASLPPGQPDGLPRRPPGQTPTRISSEPLDRPAHRDRCDNRPVAVVYRCTHRGNARLALFDSWRPMPHRRCRAGPGRLKPDRAGGSRRRKRSCAARGATAGRQDRRGHRLAPRKAARIRRWCHEAQRGRGEPPRRVATLRLRSHRA